MPEEQSPNGNGTKSDQRRLVAGAASVADYPPTSRPRDTPPPRADAPSGSDRGSRRPGSGPSENGNLFDPPLPGEGALHKRYAEAMAIIERTLPLHAARLWDLMDRVDESIRRFRAVRREEVERKGLLNEETKAEREELERRIEQWRAELDLLQDRFNPAIIEALETWKETRARAAQVYADAGLTFQNAADDELTDLVDFEKVRVGPEEEPAPVAEAAPDPAPAVPAPLWKRLLRRGATTPAAPVPAANAAAPAATSNAPDGGRKASWLERLRKPPAPLPFDPVAEARKRVPSTQAIASESGLPFPSASGNMGKHWWHKLLAALSTVTLGAIFGVSLALLATFLKPGYLSDRHKAGLVGAYAAVGIPGFWIMGRTVAMLSAHAAENFALDAVAEDFIGKARRLMRRILGFLIGATFILLVVECCVEYNGVVTSMLRQQAKMSLGMAHGQAALTIWDKLPLVCVALIVSLPFFFFHITEAWLEARAATIRHHVEAIRERRVWTLADTLRERHEAEARAEAAKAEAKAAALEGGEANGVNGENGTPRLLVRVVDENGHAVPPAAPGGNAHMGEGNGHAHGPGGEPLHHATSAATALLEERVRAGLHETNGMNGSDNLHDPNGEEETGWQDASGNAYANGAGGAGKQEDTSASRATAADVAVVREQVYLATRDLREARAKMYERTNPVKARIAVLEKRWFDLLPPVETDTMANRRIEDAYHDLQGATQSFDAEFRSTANLIEQISRPGAWLRLKCIASGRPIPKAVILTHDGRVLQ